MTEDPPESYQDLSRGRAGCWLFAMPILAAVLVVGAYGVLMLAGLRGHDAAGDRVRIELTGCPAAEPLVRARVDAMGLGAPEWQALPDGFAVTATLPDDADVAAAVPRTLAAPGRFRLMPGDAVDAEPLATNAGIDTVMLEWGMLGDAKTKITLKPDAAVRLRDAVQASPGMRPIAWIDEREIRIPGDALGRSPEKVALMPSTENPRAAMAELAEWALLLEHGPLPCAPAVVASPAP